MVMNEEQNMELALKQCNILAWRHNPQVIRTQPGGKCYIKYGHVQSAKGAEESILRELEDLERFQ